MSKEKLRVGVFMGGISIEREVSFNSGRTVCDHLDVENYTIIPIFQTQKNKLFILPLHFLHRGKISDFEHRLTTEAKEIAWDDLKNNIEFAYIAMHGRYAEDGTLQGFLEVLGVPYLGTKIFGSALGMNKIVQKIFLRNAGINVPKSTYIASHDVQTICYQKIVEKMAQASLTLPCIIKPNQEGSSLGITVVFNQENLHQAIVTASKIHHGIYQDVLIEEYIEGMEFSCITLTDYTTGDFVPLPPTQIIKEKGSHFHNYSQKYMPGCGLKITPAQRSKQLLVEIQKTCVKVMKVLDFTNISRVDGIVTKENRIVIFDPNSLSGMAPTSFLFKQAAEINMNHTDLINHLIKTELMQTGTKPLHGKKKRTQVVKAKNKIRVAVLFGGASNEREISLESGRNVVYKLSPEKYSAIPIFVSDTLELFNISNQLLVSNSTHEIEKRLEQNMHVKWQNLSLIADFVFIALHGGAGENGAVQGTLEMLGLPYNGSSILTSALCMDKYKTNVFLKSNGFDVPKGFFVAYQTWQNNHTTVLEDVKKIGFPCIIKPHDDGCSVMVERVETIAQATNALNIIFANKKSAALVEEYVIGMELTGAVLGNETPTSLPPSQAIAQQGILSIEEKFLPGLGENQTPAPLSKTALKLVQKTLENVYKSVNCKGYARIDCFYQTKNQSPTNKERVVVLEINTLPGLTPATCIFHQAAEAGIRPMEFIDRIVEYGFEEHSKKIIHVHTSNDLREKLP